MLLRPFCRRQGSQVLFELWPRLDAGFLNGRPGNRVGMEAAHAAHIELGSWFSISEQRPSAKPKVIADALTDQNGFQFSNRVVSQTLLMAKKSGGMKSRTKGTESVSKTLLSAASLVKAAGGFENAKKALEILAS